MLQSTDPCHDSHAGGLDGGGLGKAHQEYFRLDK